jgi:hypothetical protein
MRDDLEGADLEGFDEAAGTFEGRTFPSEAEWLALPSPPISGDFVERTVAAIQDDRGAAPANGHDEAEPLTPDLLAAFQAPSPTRDFATRTVRAVQEDRAARWRELLARYVAPDPSPDFVARTLAALARPADTADPRPVRHRSAVRAWTWPLLLAAAMASVLVLLHEPARAPVELRIAQQVRPALAHAYAASPLPAVLAEFDRQQDPDAPPNGEADGLWLLQRRNR